MGTKNPESTLCTQCGGDGEIIHRQGFFTLFGMCPSCEGTGRKPLRAKKNPNEDLKDKLLH